MKKSVLIALLVGTFLGCANKPCKIEDREKTNMTTQQKSSSQNNDLTKRVFVFKPDGSVQCDSNGKISLDAMKKDLAGIEIFSAENKHDGMMRIQVCGAPTGFCNVYEISEKDLEKANGLGFRKWIY
jgi:hypothetical protein